MDDAADAVVTTESRVAKLVYSRATMTLTILQNLGLDSIPDLDLHTWLFGYAS